MKTATMTISAMSSQSNVSPPYFCDLCPRLSNFLKDCRETHPDYFNGPVESFGDPNAELLIVGLAPGMHGANQTGRPFTGDYAGDLLYKAIAAHGFPMVATPRGLMMAWRCTAR